MLSQFQKYSFLKKIIVIFSVIYLLWITCLTIYAYIDFNNFIYLLEKTLTRDGNIEAEFMAFFKILISPLYLFIVLILFYNLFIYFPSIPINYLCLYLIIFTSHLYLHLNQDYFFDQPWSEDGFMEWATFYLSIIAVFLFFISGIFGDKIAFFLGLIWFLFAMEEISWGQRIFDMKSPQFVEQYNYQQETNIHNFINPLIKYLYLPFFLLLSSIFTYFRRVKKLSEFYKLENVVFLLNVSDKYRLPVILLLCTLISPRFFNLDEFLEQHFALYGFILSFLLFIELLKLKKKI